MVLTDFLKRIADAIRSKDGSSDVIPANEFAQRIIDLPAGGSSIPVAMGTFTPAENIKYVEVEHGMDVIPNISIIFPIHDNFVSTANSIWAYVSTSVLPQHYGAYSNWGNIGWIGSKTEGCDIYDEKKIMFNGNSQNANLFFRAGICYYWMAMYIESGE